MSKLDRYRMSTLLQEKVTLDREPVQTIASPVFKKLRKPRAIPTMEDVPPKTVVHIASSTGVPAMCGATVGRACKGPELVALVGIYKWCSKCLRLYGVVSAPMQLTEEQKEKWETWLKTWRAERVAKAILLARKKSTNRTLSNAEAR